MRKRLVGAALQIALLGSCTMFEAARSAEDGTLDNMWSESAGSTKGSPAGDASGKAPAALCSVESLNHSDLIKTGGWPGIGPFKPENGGFVDAGQNRIRVLSANNKVTAAELRLNNQTKQTALVNLEMSTDFLLESLGAKPARISDLNTQFEKIKAKILQSTKADPISLSAGSYVVNVHPEPLNDQADRLSFVISVIGKDVSSELLAGDTSSRAALTKTAQTAIDTGPPRSSALLQVKPNKKAATSATHDNSTANVTATAVSKQSAPPKADSKFVTTGSTKTETTNVASSSTKPDTTRVAANSTNSESAGASKNESASLSKTENVTTDTTKRTKKPAYTFNSGNPSDLNFSVETVRKVSNTSRQTDPNKNSTTETSTPKTAQATATKPAEQTRSSSLVAEKGVSDPKAPANTTAEATKTETMNGWESSSKPQSNDATIATATLPDVASHAVPSETTDPAANAGQPGGDLKQTFTDIIQSWQNIKKAAVKSKDLTELPQVLSGKTLIRQSDAIKWLVTNHKYYDMTPKGVVVDRIVDLGKGQKYAVYAQVKEYSKYMDDATNQVLKVTDDVYNVNYTLEKTGDKWLISDSAILNLPPKAIAGKTTSAKTNKSR